MNFVAVEVFHVLMRWVHIVSAVVTVGGIAYARLVEAPALELIPEEDRPSFGRVLNERFRPLLYAGLAGLLVSGLYNFVITPGHTRYYHFWFGLKMLLVLHLFATAFLTVRTGTGSPNEQAQRIRRLSGMFVVGLMIILISAFLRRIF